MLYEQQPGTAFIKKVTLSQQTAFLFFKLFYCLLFELTPRIQRSAAKLLSCWIFWHGFPPGLQLKILTLTHGQADFMSSTVEQLMFLTLASGQKRSVLSIPYLPEDLSAMQRKFTEALGRFLKESKASFPFNGLCCVFMGFNVFALLLAT